MQNITLPAQDVYSDLNAGPRTVEWQRVVLWFPRVALFDDMRGMRRKLLWPGVYRTRRSRRYNQLIYRR